MDPTGKMIEMPSAGGKLVLQGDWSIAHAARLARELASAPSDCAAIDATDIGVLDSAGALLLLNLAARSDLAQDRIALRSEHRDLFEVIARAVETEHAPEQARAPVWIRALDRIGVTCSSILRDGIGLVGFFGLTLVTLAAALPRPRRWRLTSTVHHMQQSGLDALPLVSLLSFLIGAVVAFLGATVLRDFGAELFVVDLTTYAFLREFGVLLTAILLAGRTASAFTAQIGTMQSREEIDAIRTLGQDPIELLVLPRLIALVIMLPLLSVVATLAGLLGGLAVATLSLGIPVEMYVNRVYETATLSHYLTGLSKAPVFAMVIALIGCLEGFKVTGTAQSVGERTTSAVVQSISTVIIINALAAVFFMEMGW
ncbi:MAG: ABC transporter permease [Wenzhouxiangella sp.]|nr:MAG: ABC transporter permease [Wenzhouxiangella sp.]